jgi:hypothetical protein
MASLRVNGVVFQGKTDSGDKIRVVGKLLVRGASLWPCQSIPHGSSTSVRQ